MNNDGTPTPAPGETPEPTSRVAGTSGDALEPDQQQPQALSAPKPSRTASTVSSIERCLALALGVAVLLCIAGVVSCLLRLGIGPVLFVLGFALGTLTLAIVTFAFAAGASFLLFLSAIRSVVIIPRTLFFRARLRLSDLILIVALLGNAEGLLFTAFRPASPGIRLLFAALIALWILGGAAWGMWVCTEQDWNALLRRWGLILLGISIPVQVLTAAFGLFHLCVALFLPLTESPRSDLSAPTSLVLGIGSLLLAIPATRYSLRTHEATAARQKARIKAARNAHTPAS